MALTAHHEEELAETLIYMERVGGGWTCADLSNAMVTIVDACYCINKHPTLGRTFVWISTADNNIRVKRCVGKAWFTRFFIDWRHLILEQKPQTLAKIHAQCWTRQGYFLHFTQLGETLRKFGLIGSTGLITKPANVINYDECSNIIDGQLCGSHMVTSLGSASRLFNGSRRMMRSCFPCHRTAPPLTRTSKSFSRDGTIITAMRSSNTSSICDTRMLSSTRKTLHSCLVEHGKTGDPQNELSRDSVLLGSPLQDWIHMPLPTQNLWPPGPRRWDPLCPLRPQWNCHLPLQWESQCKSVGRPP